MVNNNNISNYCMESCLAGQPGRREGGQAVRVYRGQRAPSYDNVGYGTYNGW